VIIELVICLPLTTCKTQEEPKNEKCFDPGDERLRPQVWSGKRQAVRRQTLINLSFVGLSRHVDQNRLDSVSTIELETSPFSAMSF
jgi:hypothetical protein